MPDGSLIGWGGETSNPVFPIPSDLTNVVSVATVGSGAIALRADGTVLEWNSIVTNSHPELSNVIAVATDSYRGAVLLFDGSVVAWPDPAPEGLTNITALVGGEGNFLALREDGTPIGWGCDCHGAVNIPPELTNAMAIAVGGSDGYSHSAFIIGLTNPPPPVLSLRLNGSQPRLEIAGTARRRCVVEESTDLSSATNWTFKQNMLFDVSAQAALDLPGANPGPHYYRARILP